MKNSQISSLYSMYSIFSHNWQKVKKRRLRGKKREKRRFIEASRKMGINRVQSTEPATHDDIEEIEDKPF